jgi:hypothetical protein
MNLSQAARLVGLASGTLRVGIDRGDIDAERPIACGPWVLNKQNLETERARRFLERVRRGKCNPTAPSPAQATFELSTT